MTSPYADLRARLAPLAAAAGDGTDIIDLLRRLEDHRHLDHNERRWVTWAIQDIEQLHELVNAYPEIDALLARGEAAEADADRLHTAANAASRLILRGLRHVAIYEFSEAKQILDHTLALRERPS